MKILTFLFGWHLAWLELLKTAISGNRYLAEILSLAVWALAFEVRKRLQMRWRMKEMAYQRKKKRLELENKID